MNNTKIWFTSVILILIVFIFAFFDDLFMTILIAAVLAFLLNPITNWFHKLLKTKKRTIPTLLTMLLALAAVGGLLWLFLPPLYRQIETVIVSIDDYIEMLSDMIDQLSVKLDRFPFSDKLVGGVDSLIENSEDKIISLVTTIGTKILAVTFKLFDAIVFFVITFHFLSDGKMIVNSLINMFGRNVRIRLRRMGSELKDLIWGYMGVKLITSVVVFFLTLGIYSAFGIPNALLLAFIAFVLEFIPFFGPIVSGIVATLAALIGTNWQSAIWILLISILLQQIEGNIIEPIVQGKKADVHPVAIIISLLVCDKLWGIIGMFLAIPMAGFAKVIFLELRDLYRTIDCPQGFGYATPEPLVSHTDNSNKRARKIMLALKNKFKKESRKEDINETQH
ncbi:MAG: AI-2E family transporter [Clostridia bacterium]|nr:AI-2E family transporter [Clostridia bacterium]